MSLRVFDALPPGPGCECRPWQVALGLLEILSDSHVDPSIT